MRYAVAAHVEARECRQTPQLAFGRTPLGPTGHMRRGREQIGRRVVQRVDEEDELYAPQSRVARAHVEEELERQREEHCAGGQAAHEAYPCLALGERTPERRLPQVSSTVPGPRAHVRRRAQVARVEAAHQQRVELARHTARSSGRYIN